MAISQQKLREITFQLLFSQNFSDGEDDEIIPFMMHQLSVTKKVMKEAQEKCNEVISKLTEIDASIIRFCDAYDFKRISEVEKSILRLAIFEFCFVDSLPPKVTISEAIRLARKFATAESAGFVNAVLDAAFQANLTEGKKENELLAPVSAE